MKYFIPDRLRTLLENLQPDLSRLMPEDKKSGVKSSSTLGLKDANHEILKSFKEISTLLATQISLILKTESTDKICSTSQLTMIFGLINAFSHYKTQSLLITNLETQVKKFAESKPCIIPLQIYQATIRIYLFFTEASTIQPPGETQLILELPQIKELIDKFKAAIELMCRQPAFTDESIKQIMPEIIDSGAEWIKRQLQENKPISAILTDEKIIGGFATSALSKKIPQAFPRNLFDNIVKKCQATALKEINELITGFASKQLPSIKNDTIKPIAVILQNELDKDKQELKPPQIHVETPSVIEMPLELKLETKNEEKHQLLTLLAQEREALEQKIQEYKQETEQLKDKLQTCANTQATLTAQEDKANQEIKHLKTKLEAENTKLFDLEGKASRAKNNYSAIQPELQTLTQTKTILTELSEKIVLIKKTPDLKEKLNNFKKMIDEQKSSSNIPESIIQNAKIIIIQAKLIVSAREKPKTVTDEGKPLSPQKKFAEGISALITKTKTEIQERITFPKNKITSLTQKLTTLIEEKEKKIQPLKKIEVRHTSAQRNLSLHHAEIEKLNTRITQQDTLLTQTNQQLIAQQQLQQQLTNAKITVETHTTLAEATIKLLEIQAICNPDPKIYEQNFNTRTNTLFACMAGEYSAGRTTFLTEFKRDIDILEAELIKVADLEKEILALPTTPETKQSQSDLVTRTEDMKLKLQQFIVKVKQDHEPIMARLPDCKQLTNENFEGLRKHAYSIKDKRASEFQLARHMLLAILHNSAQALGHEILQLHAEEHKLEKTLQITELLTRAKQAIEKITIGIGKQPLVKNIYSSIETLTLQIKACADLPDIIVDDHRNAIPLLDDIYKILNIKLSAAEFYHKISKPRTLGHNFSNQEIRGYTIDNAELERADFQNATVSDCKFTNCNFRFANFCTANLIETKFTNCNLTEIDINRDTRLDWQTLGKDILIANLSSADVYEYNSSYLKNLLNIAREQKVIDSQLVLTILEKIGNDPDHTQRKPTALEFIELIKPYLSIGDTKEIAEQLTQHRHSSSKFNYLRLETGVNRYFGTYGATTTWQRLFAILLTNPTLYNANIPTTRFAELQQSLSQCRLFACFSRQTHTTHVVNSTDEKILSPNN